MGSIDGKVERKNGSIILLMTLVKKNYAGVSVTVGRQNGPDQVLTPPGNEVMIATLEIAHEGVEKA
jgi:hypothetical protein